VADSNVHLQHLQNLKSNPYVGWFRHSPPLPLVGSKHVLSCSKLEELAASTCSVVLKKRRYLSTTGHRLQQYDPERMKTLHFKIKQALEELKCGSRSHNNEYYYASLKKRGYLRGGGRSDEPDLESFLQEQYKGNESITLKALTRLAFWFFDVPVETTSKCIDEQHDGASVVSDDDEDDASEMDNFDTVDGSRYQRRRTASMDQEDGADDSPRLGPIGSDATQPDKSAMYLSTQAEAYYALSAVYDSMLEERDSTSTFSPQRRHSGSMDESRLDYDITQMDIVRMNRIASRHLDVESIVRLPVRTYEPPGATSDGSLAVPVQRESAEDYIEASAAVAASNESYSAASEGDKQDTEFSWMLVPPPEPTSSFDDHSVIEHPDATSPVAAPNPATDSYSPPTSDAVPQDDVCVICLERFVQGDRMRVLPCSHSFHVGCIDRWLSGSHSFHECYTAGCPTCKKRPVVTPLPLEPNNQLPSSLDGSVPSWAFARIGDILAKDDKHF
jgi:Ring finger domain